MNSYERGLLAEEYAAKIMRLKGYHIIERRFKSYVGEIDLICRKKDIVVFVEVKQRKNRQQFFEAISRTQQKRIMRAAAAYLKYRKLYNVTQRFDIFFISLPFYYRHIKNVFWES